MKVNLDACIRGCIRGDKPAWDDFVRECAPLIYAAVRRAFRGKADGQQNIEDRVQDVFVTLLKNDCHLLRAFDPKRAALSTYLTLISRSVVYQHAQKRKIDTAPIASVDPAAPQSAVHEPLPILNGLTDRQEIVLKMLFEQNMTVEEAAHRLGVDPQTIRSTKHKALSRLRSQFSRGGAGALESIPGSAGDVS